MKFILNRTEDYKSRSKKWMVGYSLCFWLITRIIAAIIIIACVAIYKSSGIDPEPLTKFGGSPSQAASRGSLLYSIFVVMIVSPLLEEGIFRLWLSFKKWQIGVSVALIPVAAIWQNYHSFAIWQFILFSLVAVLLYSAVFWGSRQIFWDSIRVRHIVAGAWISAVAFGLMHLIAFTTLSWILLPYCLCVILVPFFAGCACTYLRINMGFWWGLGMHILNNIPAIIMICLI